MFWAHQTTREGLAETFTNSATDLQSGRTFHSGQVPLCFSPQELNVVALRQQKRLAYCAHEQAKSIQEVTVFKGADAKTWENAVGTGFVLVGSCNFQTFRNYLFYAVAVLEFLSELVSHKFLGDGRRNARFSVETPLNPLLMLRMPKC